MKGFYAGITCLYFPADSKRQTAGMEVSRTFLLARTLEERRGNGKARPAHQVTVGIVRNGPPVQPCPRVEL